ncbi:NAD(P)/FAD-dependent oxidoreductase [Gordonia terrae]|uniref:NAD(P)/FAD-dependent oxidoreductase n=1 Tax=Gordonia terrae TaxID=2055 RepID=UPI003F6C3FD2
MVIGAGYAGVMAANRIAGSGSPDTGVTVICPHARFVQRIRLHEHAAGTSSAVVPLHTVLNDSVTVVRDRAVEITDQKVMLSTGDIRHFDVLIYAVGSGDPPGSTGAGFAIGVPEDAFALTGRLRSLTGNAPVTVIGGGLTAVETAAEIAFARSDLSVRLIAGTICDGLPESSRQRVIRELDKLGVAVTTGSHVTAVTDDAVRVNAGREFASDCTVWASGFRIPDLARHSGLPTDPLGRLRVDQKLISAGNSRVIGAGDAVVLAGTPFRMSCQAALPMGAHAADTAIRLVKGIEPQPFTMGFIAQAVSLGRHSAIVQGTHRDDSSARWRLSGSTAATMKELVCRSTVWAMRHPRAYRWVPGPASRSSGEVVNG